jgi:hypothetical protein
MRRMKLPEGREKPAREACYSVPTASLSAHFVAGAPEECISIFSDGRMKKRLDVGAYSKHNSHILTSSTFKF